MHPHTKKYDRIIRELLIHLYTQTNHTRDYGIPFVTEYSPFEFLRGHCFPPPLLLLKSEALF